MVIYANKYCLQSIIFVIGPTGMLIGWFLGIVKYIKERSANKFIILKA